MVLVVEHALPAELRQQKLAEFARLYEFARGEKPPTGDRDERAEDAVEPRSGPDTERKLLQRIAELERKLLASRVEVSQLRADQAAQSLGLSPAPDDLPRQRAPLSGPPAGTPNTRHFPPAQARGGGSAESHYRQPRLDMASIGLPGQSRGERYWVVQLRHGRQPEGGAPSNLRSNL
ncbi:hypothetical protein GCM10027614_48460 [Micromonospora vulcania]